MRPSFCLHICFRNILPHDPHTEQLDASDKYDHTDKRSPSGYWVSKTDSPGNDHKQRNEKTVISIPNQEAMRSGVCEKLTMSSTAYRNSFPKSHFTSSCAGLATVKTVCPVAYQAYSITNTLYVLLRTFFNKKIYNAKNLYEIT